MFGGYTTVCACCSILPESPRWLLVHSKWKRADRNLRKIAAVNKRSIPKNFDVSTLEIIVQVSQLQPIRLGIFISIQSDSAVLMMYFKHRATTIAISYFNQFVQ